MAGVLVVSVVGAGAQQTVRPRVGQTRRAVVGKSVSPAAATHATFEKAAKVMESALPIYDGHRHRAIELAKLAAKEVREAATGAGGSVTAGVHKTAAERAAMVHKGPNVALSKYSAAQISASNAKMQAGIQLLQQGMQQLQALGQDAGGHVADAAVFGNEAIQAANKGLQWVAGR